MSKAKNILILSISFIMLSATGFAQSNSPTDSTVLIINSGFKPFLTDAFKIKDNPSIKDTGKIIPKLNYSFLDKQIPVGFQIDLIKAAKIKGEPLVKLYRGYAKVGFGTNTTPLAELYYNAKRSKNLSFGFFGKHLSSNGIAKNDYSGYSNNHLSFFGKHFSKEFTTIGKVGYTRDVNHYYGISEKAFLNPSNDLTLVNKASTKQKIDKIDIGFSLARNFTDSSQLDYNAAIDFHNLKDKFGVTENHLELAGNLSKYHKQELYSLGVEVNYNKLINPLSLDRNLVLGINPTISTSTEKWQFKVGIGLYLNSYPDTKFHFYPKAEFKYNVVEDIIIPYVGIRGGLISNNLNTFYKENPFINTVDLAVQNTNQKYDIYGGIRGSLSSKLTFNTSFSQQKLEGLPLYVKDFGSLLENKFLVSYDTVNISTITTELTYQKLEKLKVLLGAKYFKYTPKNEIKAWHKPDLKISLSGIYDLSDKIIVRADFYYFSQQYAKSLSTITSNNITTTTEIASKLKGVFDANIGLEYRYTKKLSAYINFNNIGSVRYERFQDYPTQKFGVLGGLTYSF
tara:strand:- start:4070 stop:5770 length:1701 start_codon:yes stop_codon:yes gene_type:complete